MTPMMPSLRERLNAGTAGAITHRALFKAPKGSLAAAKLAKAAELEAEAVARIEAAGKKPWGDRPAPWGTGDPDGEEDDVYDTPPGNEHDKIPGRPADDIYEQPPGTERPGTPDPNNALKHDKLTMRATYSAAAERIAATKPDAFRALLAIEARLGEISLYLPAAVAGFDGGEVLAKLKFLKEIL